MAYTPSPPRQPTRRTDTSDPSSELKVTIDKDAPEITFSNTFAASYDYGDVPAGPTCTANDGASGSGADGNCVVSVYKTEVGSQALTGKAKDVAGNEGTEQMSYIVSA
jgi:hypothetical protein